jgi:hypothetical protein
MVGLAETVLASAVTPVEVVEAAVGLVVKMQMVILAVLAQVILVGLEVKEMA